MAKIDLPIVVLNLIICLILTGCKNNNGENLMSIGYRAQQINNEVMSCIENDNSEALKEMFCKKVLDAYPNIYDDIERFFEFIDGNIVSYKKPIYSEDGSKKDGEWIKYRSDPQIYGIITDTNKEYNLIYYNILVCKDDPDRIGISEMVITEEDTNLSCKIGDVYLANPELKH